MHALIRMVVIFVIVVGVQSLFMSPPHRAQSNISSSGDDVHLANLEKDLLRKLNDMRARRRLLPFVFSNMLYGTAKDHSRRMALDQKLEHVAIKALLGKPANSSTTFWRGVSATVAQLETQSPSEIIDAWLQNRSGREIVDSRTYNSCAIGASTDTKGLFYTTLIAGEELREESNLVDLGRNVFDAVNKARGERGLRALQFDAELARIARDHSRDMAAKNYFSHINLEGRSPSDRLKLNNYTRWTESAENIESNLGMRDPVKAAVQGWLKSRSHAANIFHAGFTRTGVGIAKAIDGTYYFTQMFVR